MAAKQGAAGVIDTGSHAATLGQEIESQSGDGEEEN